MLGSTQLQEEVTTAGEDSNKFNKQAHQSTNNIQQPQQLQSSTITSIAASEASKES